VSALIQRTQHRVPSLKCVGCGHVMPTGAPFPFRCPNADSGDGADHVLTRHPAEATGFPLHGEANPFVRYRTLLRSYHLALSGGMTDAEYVHLVERLDAEVAAVDGVGFEATPFRRSPELSNRMGFDRSGGVWVKDETGNVSGSHKARHLMGVLIHLAVVEEVSPGRPKEAPLDLAIASCGNAALAAAVVARAGGRRLRVFVPTWADPTVVERLEALGSVVTVCPRVPGMTGDPAYHALKEALAEGAIPFTCQGNENGLSIEGGQTLAYEMASELARSHAVLDRVFVQVGGGALGSAVASGFADAHRLGVVPGLPRLQTVQTAGAYPLKRAYDLLITRILARVDSDAGEPPRADDQARADFVRDRVPNSLLREQLAYAATHRSEFMWPWEEEPASVAHGILDDETYDWFAVVGAMLMTGGYPLVVSEDALRRSNELGRAATGIDVDHTGSAGLAGLLELRARNSVLPDERAAVLFTGVQR
jgi:threonine synthase